MSSTDFSTFELSEIGPDRILNPIFNLTDFLNDKLQRKGDVELISPVKLENRTGIVTFSIEGLEGTDKFEEYLKKRNSTISSSSHEGKLRIVPHNYNAIEETDTILNAIFK